MLNIGKLARGQQTYYLESVAKGVEDYYLGSGEAPGYWLGGGSEDLDLEGRVLERDLTPVLEGRHPETGEAMTRRHHKTRMPGFDLTFRAPKSVSLLHALGPKEASNEVVNAHNAAVAASLDYLERHTALGRRGTDGIYSIGSTGFVGAAFRHRTSRAGDPLLHTHVLVANLIHGDDGRWSALDGRLLYSHAKTAGYLYQAQLRHELTRRLGVEWTQERNGTAEIEGVPRDVIKAFSRRRAEIEIRMEQRGEHSARAAQVATLDTRRAKDYGLKPQGLVAEWERRAKELGFSRRDLARALYRSRSRMTEHVEARVVAVLVGPEGLTRDASSFTQREVIQGLCAGLGSRAAAEKIEAISESLLHSDLVVPLSPRRSQVLTTGTVLRLSDGTVVPSVTGDVRYSTQEMLRLEKRLIRRAQARADEGVAIARADSLRGSLSRRSSMSAEQRRMVRELATSGRGVEVVVGKAGTGKTFALDAAREAWQASGIKVIGCALSARAARELEAGSGINSYTLAALLADLDEPGSPGLPPGSVVVVDEAGMVGTRQLHLLLEHAEGAGAKVVLVGDDKQLPEIAAGGAFRALKERLPAIELSEVRRQRNAWEKQALELIREGRGSEAIRTYGERGRLVTGRDAEQVRMQLVADWWEASKKGAPMMIAARKGDVDDLNERARAVMRAEGMLGDREMRVAGRSFAVGDEVMTLRNDRRLGVINGTRATVEGLDGASLVVRTDDGRALTLPQDYLTAGHVTHAYAITGHKAQGMTTDRAFVLGDESLYREWGYVAMSRGRDDNRLYAVVGDSCGRDEVGGMVERPEALEGLARALERSKAKQLAFGDEEVDLADKDLLALRAERDELLSLQQSAPPNVTHQLTLVAQELEKTERAIADLARSQEKAHARLESMGRLARARRRDEVSELEATISNCTTTGDRLEEELPRLTEEQRDLERQQQSRERWLQHHAPDMDRLPRVEAEIDRQEQALVKAVERDVPSYIENELGRRPESPYERDEWRKGVLVIERFRSEHGIKDPDRALGRVRDSDRQSRELAEDAIRDAKEAQLDRSDDFGLELSLEL